MFQKSISAGRFGYPWHKSVEHTREFLSLRLYRIHPSLKEITNDFYSNYAGIRLINFTQLKQLMPLTPGEFRSTIIEQLKKCKNFLHETWLQECAFIIENYQKVIEGLATNQVIS